MTYLIDNFYNAPHVSNPNFIRDAIKMEHDESVAYQMRLLNKKLDMLITIFTTATTQKEENKTYGNN